MKTPMTLRQTTAMQTTLRRPVTLKGTGVHLGLPARITLSAADAGTGIAFLRSGAPSERERLVTAHWSQVSSTELRIKVGDGVGSVSTIEHLMAALYGLGVDNALIEIDGPEVPAMDGSAGAFVNAIDASGVTTLCEPRRVLRVLEPVRVTQGAAWAELRPAPAGFHMDVEIAFPQGPIGRQRRSLTLTAGSFRRDLSRARSFGFVHDAERLWKAGLALGASLDNTVAIAENRVLNPEGLHFTDEFVRHKMLDVVGDLALAGAPLIGAFRSYCGGHSLNFALVDALLSTPAAFAIDGATRPRRGFKLQPHAAR